MIADETNGKNGIIFTRDKAYIGAVASQFSLNIPICTVLKKTQTH